MPVPKNVTSRPGHWCRRSARGLSYRPGNPNMLLQKHQGQAIQALLNTGTSSGVLFFRSLTLSLSLSFHLSLSIPCIHSPHSSQLHMGRAVTPPSPPARRRLLRSPPCSPAGPQAPHAASEHPARQHTGRLQRRPLSLAAPAPGPGMAGGGTAAGVPSPAARPRCAPPPPRPRHTPGRMPLVRHSLMRRP